MNTFFNEGTVSLDSRRWIEEDSPWKAQKIHRILEQNNLKPKTICEIGCGAGGVIENLTNNYDKSVQFFGYESYEEGFSLCKKREKINLQYFNKDLLKEDAYYDVVMAINVFTHVRDYLGFLSKLRQKGKYKVFHIPLQVTVYSILRGQHFQKSSSMKSHLHHFNKETALGTLQGTGYEIIDYFYTSGLLELPNRGPKAKFWKLPTKFLYWINKDFAARMLGGFSLMVLTK